jgi:hypothetical protein
VRRDKVGEKEREERERERDRRRKRKDFRSQSKKKTLNSLSSRCAAAGRAKTPPVVFLDTDILVVGSIVERVFGNTGGSSSASLPFGAPTLSSSLKQAAASSSPSPSSFDFDYCCTLSDSVDMPINFGIQFVAPGKTQRAAEFLKGVCSVYDFSSTFTAGQEVWKKKEKMIFWRFFFYVFRVFYLFFSLKSPTLSLSNSTGHR